MSGFSDKMQFPKKNNPVEKQQKKTDTFQFEDKRQSGLDIQRIQRKISNSPQTTQLKEIQSKADEFVKKTSPIQRVKNNTNLPNQIKSGIENLSGHSMDDVKVHYNSSKPAQLNAHAYAQGTEIHLGPGQEKHLPHEAWHVVQQKQGRVQPTIKVKGTAINDNPSLEKEADVMGNRVVQGKGIEHSQTQKPDSAIEKPVAQLMDNIVFNTFDPFADAEFSDEKNSSGSRSRSSSESSSSDSDSDSEEKEGPSIADKMEAVETRDMFSDNFWKEHVILGSKASNEELAKKIARKRLNAGRPASTSLFLTPAKLAHIKRELFTRPLVGGHRYVSQTTIEYITYSSFTADGSTFIKDSGVGHLDFNVQSSRSYADVGGAFVFQFISHLNKMVPTNHRMTFESSKSQKQQIAEKEMAKKSKRGRRKK